jgi:thiol-disulfide isomerase/thioredoxin
VVLLDFWTYSCINCQRTLPHLEAWYRAYKDAGFVIIGVHTPEFVSSACRPTCASRPMRWGSKPGVSMAYQFPTELRPNTFGLSGTWTASPQSLNAGPGAQLELNFEAKKVHLVAGGQGNVQVSVDGRPDTSVAVNGPPTLYTLLEQPQNQRMTIRLTPDPGVQAYSFTFD